MLLIQQILSFFFHLSDLSITQLLFHFFPLVMVYVIYIWSINYIEQISIKRDAKKMKDYQISKIFIALCYWNLSANSLSMITQFSYMSIYQNSIFLCQNMVAQNINKFPIRCKEFYIKTTKINLELIILEKLASNVMKKRWRLLNIKSYYCSILL